MNRLSLCLLLMGLALMAVPAASHLNSVAAQANPTVPPGDIRIDWNANDTMINGSVVIMGSVDVAGFSYYFLEAARFPLSPDGASWIPLTLPRNQIVRDGVLATWDTTTLPDAPYALRLRAVLINGTTIAHTIAPIAVNNDGDTRSSAPVRVVSTAIPIYPTSTPAPTPIVSPTPRVIEARVLTNPRAPITTGLETGGHIAYIDDAAMNAMRRAGMRWIKWQVRYRVGDNAGQARDLIAQARAQGFKVLLSIVGDKNELATLGTAYYDRLADYMRQVAQYAPDAIEVWNEPNLDREWVTGHISPSAYTLMLRASYQAIKAVDPRIIVISAAPAPTGAEGFFGLARVWNDDRYMQGMMAAGATQYMDCIGVHYNDGIIPPDQIAGDPRGDYPTYYLPRLLDRVADAFAGATRPICITELGYLTAEGYPPLPSGFAWANGNTLAEHAAWLRQARDVLARYTRLPVRLMIVWNINFTTYNSDPQAGFAIIRPDGSCPACNALGGG